MAGGAGIEAYLAAGLKAAGLRGRVIANNVANLTTPGFRRGEVRFEELLARALSSDRRADPASLAAEVLQPKNTPINAAGSDVDLDIEVGEMVKNGAKTGVYLRTLAKVYRQMELAMRDSL